MSNSIAPGSSANVNVKVTALTTNQNVPAQYKTIILKKNLVNGVNTLTQEMMSATNTKYVVKYDYVLGENITVPVDCVLEFDGGSIKSGGDNKNTILGNQTTINSDVAYNIFNDCIIKNFNLPYIDIRWFGAKVSDPVNNVYFNARNAIARALECTRYHHGLYLYICGYYYLANGIETDLDLRIKGNTYVPRPKEDSEPSKDYISAKSVLYIGGNVTAFTLHGRSLDASVSKMATICLENISFVGSINNGSRISNFIYSDASGSPTRPSIIRECEFTDFNICLSLHERPGIDIDGSIYGQFTIEQCRFIRNNYIMYVPYNSNFGVTNIALRDSCCEYNTNGLEIATYGNIVVDNCEFGETEKPIQIKCAQTTYITITNNYFESIFGEDKYAINIYGKDARYDKAVIYNNSYNAKIYASNIKLINCNNLTNYNYETDSLFYRCWFSRCEDSKFLKPSNINDYCLFDSQDYDFISSVKSDDGYVINMSPDTILNNKGFYKKLVDQTQDAHYAAVHLPASQNALIVQHLIIDGEPNNENTVYKAKYAQIGQVSIEGGDLYLKERGDFVVVWNACIIPNVDQYFYMWKYGLGTLYKDNAIVYSNGFKSNKRLFNYPAFSSKPYGSTRPTNPAIGMEFFDTSISPARPIYWNGTAWVDATGATV